MKNTILVYLNDNHTVDTHDNCSMVVDNCDGSVRIERKSETVAHYSPGSWTKIHQILQPND
jgi:hypothetical protein